MRKQNINGYHRNSVSALDDPETLLNERLKEVKKIGGNSGHISINHIVTNVLKVGLENIPRSSSGGSSTRYLVRESKTGTRLVKYSGGMKPESPKHSIVTLPDGCIVSQVMEA
uniref:Uncharacterized protein n=1 Tax=Glossina austeni TaxID=7395 RepID=A0A1A9UE57_GLOAU